MRTGLLLVLAALSLAAQEPQQFLETYCLRCHGAEKLEGDLDLRALPRASSTWAEVRARLAAGEMPPEGAPQPSAAEVQDLCAWIAAAQPKERRRGELRRLDTFEYRNTVRDLLGLDLTLSDPTRAFPSEGESRVLSGPRLQAYLDAADACIERAVCAGEAPESETVVLAPPFMRWGGDLLPEAVRRATSDYEELFTRPTGNAGYLVPDELAAGVAHPGEYLVRVRACALGREHPYAEVATDPAEPLRLGIVVASARDGELRSAVPNEVRLAEFELEDDTPQVVEVRVRLEAGSVPRLAFTNGPYVRPHLAFLNLREVHHPELLERHRGRQWRDELVRLRIEAAELLEVYRGPRVRVFAIEVEGPLADAWPPQSHTRLFAGAQDAAAVLTRFATRAFRRPVTGEDLGPILALVERRRAAGASELEATKAGLKAILCCPDFLHHDLSGAGGWLDDHALASRLSYFLWSSMPDEELTRLAAEGELRRPEMLHAQAQRLLADPRSAGFVEHFTQRWLGLDHIAAMPPDPDLFPVYYQTGVEASLLGEPRAFFAHLLARNLDVVHFLDSDYTFVDGALARLYRIPEVHGQAFRQVTLPDRRRGGLLGQAAVLAATANGVDTSPVVRGAWVLETLLGVPPGTPPASTPLEPDTRGTTTLRRQLEQHRADEGCATCHLQIDPLGFPLESYDAIGAWRARYGPGLPVDPSATTVDGGALRHVGDLRLHLVERKAEFVEALVRELVAHATGTPVAANERAEVERLVADAGSGLRDLVLGVVGSELFRRN